MTGIVDSNFCKMAFALPFDYEVASTGCSNQSIKIIAKVWQDDHTTVFIAS
ncbi:hypothetical protein [Variovorax sp. ZT5R36]|uniref:hypothetical protein n=1 Tax=Variovorax sp. ZT5R36 TaxID=3443734 RepID=UPI003F498E41